MQSTVSPAIVRLVNHKLSYELSPQAKDKRKQRLISTRTNLGVSNKSPLGHGQGRQHIGRKQEGVELQLSYTKERESTTGGVTTQLQSLQSPEISKERCQGNSHHSHAGVFPDTSAADFHFLCHV